MKYKIKKMLVGARREVRKSLPVSLRTNIGEIFYQESKKLGRTKPLEEEDRLKEWDHWALIENAFPYSAAFKIHHMLIPKRVVTKQQLSAAEKLELENILDELSSTYDCQMINFPRNQSRHNHFHIHLMVYKNKRSEIKLR